jgi:hypothetical protein
MGHSAPLRETIARSGRSPDERGLLPLDVARELLADATSYPGAPVHEGRSPQEVEDVKTSHALHAALVSLESAEEALSHLTRLVWKLPLYDATTLVERYGAAVFPWLASTVEEGRLVCKAWGVEPALTMLGSEEAFELLLRLRSIDFNYEPRVMPLGSIASIPELDKKARVDVRVVRAIDAFIAANPVVAARVVGRRLSAAPKEKRPRELVKLLPETPEVASALGVPRPVETVTTKLILAVLDESAKDPAPQSWPKFATGIEDDPATLEYHALRLIAARSKRGEDWGVVIERVTGSFSPWEPARVEQFLYGSRVRDKGLAGERKLDLVLDQVPDHQNGETLGLSLDGVTIGGPAGDVQLSDAFGRTHELKPGLGCEYEGDAGFNLRLRGYLAVHPRAFWEPAESAIAALRIPDPVVFVDTDAFAHVVGGTYKRPKKGATWTGVPSKSKTYESLAAAIVKRDGKWFDPGEPNVDWRLHAVNETRR